MKKSFDNLSKSYENVIIKGADMFYNILNTVYKIVLVILAISIFSFLTNL